MNKNIFSLSILLTASALYASESCDNSTTETTAEVINQETVEQTTAAQDEAITTSEEVSALEIIDQPADAAEAFVPKKFTLTYKIVKGTGSSDNDFDALVVKTKDMCAEGRRSSPDFYQKLLKFIKELQEAIFAGLNLVGVATTQEEVMINAIGNVASEIVEQVAEINNPQNETTKSEGENEVVLSYEIVIESAEKATQYEAVKEQMIELANALNNPETPSETVTQQFSNFIIAAQALENGVTSLSASVDHELPSENEEVVTEEITA